MPLNRVDLDPVWVDEYGLPVARITRDFGEHERWAIQVADQATKNIEPFVTSGAIVADKRTPKVSAGIADLICDHQLGTCRMEMIFEALSLIGTAVSTISRICSWLTLACSQQGLVSIP